MSAAAPPAVRVRGWALVLRSSRARVGVAVLSVIVAAAILAPLLVQDPLVQDYSQILAAPSPAHLLGTDNFGRDVLARLVYGARASLVVAVLSTVVGLLIGTVIGAIAGYFGGAVDMTVARGVDVMLAFPYVIIAILLSVTLGPSLSTLVAAISISTVPVIVRIVRAEAMTIAQRGFVTAAVADGAGAGTVLTRHVLPNLGDVVTVQASIVLPIAVLTEAMLSYLGLGISPPTPTWGSMLSDALTYIELAPWMAIFPGLAIMVTAFAFNLVGDTMRDVLDPRTRSQA